MRKSTIKQAARIRFPSVLKELAGDRRGVIIVMFALMLPVLLGAIGLAVEVGFWFQSKRGLQSAADAAAIAAAYTMWDGGIESGAYDDAVREANRNWDGDDFTVATFDDDIMPPTSGAYTADSSAIEVELTASSPLMIIDYLMSTSAITINARAVAALGTKSEACVLTLKSTGTAMTVSSDVNLAGCSVAVNSSDDAALKTSGTGDLTTECISVVGGASEVGGSSINTTCTESGTGAHATSDPYADLTMPADYVPGDCDYNNFSTGSDGQTINPGNYCNGLTIQNTGVTMSSGEYFIYKGQFKVNAGAGVTGDGVTIFMTGTGAQYADVQINGGASVTLTAQTTSAAYGDTYAGILFFQDPDTPTAGSNDQTFNGGTTLDLTGALYFPSGNVIINGGSSMDSTCIQVIAYTADVSGDASWDNDCAMFGDNVITIDEVKLVE